MSAEKQPEWQKQEQLRAQRRGRRGGKPRTHVPQPKDYTLGKLHLVPKPGMRDVAFRDLMVATQLRIYFPDCCRSDGARRRTVLDPNGITLEAPRAIQNQIERELRAGWQRGKLQP